MDDGEVRREGAGDPVSVIMSHIIVMNHNHNHDYARISPHMPGYPHDPKILQRNFSLREQGPMTRPRRGHADPGEGGAVRSPRINRKRDLRYSGAGVIDQVYCRDCHEPMRPKRNKARDQIDGWTCGCGRIWRRVNGQRWESNR